jgi:hypothetical protein
MITPEGPFSRLAESQMSAPVSLRVNLAFTSCEAPEDPENPENSATTADAEFSISEAEASVVPDEETAPPA